MLCCFAAGVANTRAVYRTGIKQSNQETILSEAGFNLHANLPGGERLSTQLTDYTPAGGMLKSWQAVLFHSQAFFFDDTCVAYTAASKSVLIRHPRQYAIFPAHYFW